MTWPTHSAPMVARDATPKGLIVLNLVRRAGWKVVDLQHERVDHPTLGKFSVAKWTLGRPV